MAEKDRLEGMPFTCSNRGFETNVKRGQPHVEGSASGSVFHEPLVSSGYTLWLEYVTDKGGGEDRFWLMWYDDEGTPKIPMSGVMTEPQLKDMVRKLGVHQIGD